MPEEDSHILEPGSKVAETAIPFNFNDGRAMAAKLIKRGNEQAQRLLESARQQAVDIEKTAYDDGFAKGHEAGLPKGEAEGRASGEAAVRQEIGDATATLTQALEEMLNYLSVERLELRTEAEVDLLGLALAIASRVVKHEVTHAPETILGNVREAVALTVSRRDILLRVHPDDLAAVESHLPSLKAAFTDLERVSVTADEAVGRGGVVAATADGEVDLRIAEQLAALERALIGEGGSGVLHADLEENVPSGPVVEDLVEENPVVESQPSSAQHTDQPPEPPAPQPEAQPEEEPGEEPEPLP
ncbi:MAG: FliH/SctL family protein [Planctomycetota bacterium]|jgi:flagellar biosynthesis/type III secretory pathway protein FliH